MGRRRLAPGECGEVNVQKISSGYRARCWYRGQDGRKHQIDIVRRTKTEARNAARELGKKRANVGVGSLNEESTLAALMEYWWDFKRAQGLSENTLARYEKAKDRVIEGVGSLMISECSTQVLNDWVKETAAGRPSVHKDLRIVLQQAFERGVKMEIVARNKAANIDAAPRKKNEVEALTSDEVRRLRETVQAWEESHVGKPNVDVDGNRVGGTRLTPYIADLVDVMLGSGLRIGEALGLRWEDVDLEAKPVLISVRGSVKVHKKTEDSPCVVWEDVTKTEAGLRTVPVATIAADALTRMNVERAPDAVYVFATRNGTPRSPHNVRTRLRRATGDQYPGLTPHKFRRTHATIVERELGSKAAAMVLGHASPATTEKFYIAKGDMPDTSAVLDAAFGG